MGLIAFITSLSSGTGGGAQTPPGFWILASGFWDNAGVWDNDGVWP